MGILTHRVKGKRHAIKKEILDNLMPLCQWRYTKINEVPSDFIFLIGERLFAVNKSILQKKTNIQNE